MRDFARFPTGALTWDIWQRNRTAIVWLFGIVMSAMVLNLSLPASVRDESFGNGSEGLSMALGMLNWHFVGAAFILVFAIFGYTEFNSQKSVERFPHRLFTLPVSSFRLVALPMLLGVAAIELIYAWMKLVFIGKFGSLLGAVMIGAFMVVYQTVLWTLGRLGPLRLIVLAIIGFVFFAAALLPSRPVALYSEQTLMLVSAGIGLITFFIAWICIARQRSGGNGNDWLQFVMDQAVILSLCAVAAYLVYQILARGAAPFRLVSLVIVCGALVPMLIQRVSGQLPGRRRGFRTASGAQFWFEWRRAGLSLPLLIGAILVLVIAPISWTTRAQSGGTLWILFATLAMPLVLASPVGKAFSKPDFWSSEMSIPSILGVKPLAADDIVATKVKVAIVSAVISWLMVLTFVSIWLTFWANVDAVNVLRSAVTQVTGTPVYRQVMLLALLTGAAIFVSWRSLIGSLWLGLSGRNIIFGLTAVPYAAAPFFGMVVLIDVSRHNESTLSWIRHNLDRMLPTLLWIAGLALLMKLPMAIRSWQGVSNRYRTRYIALSAVCASCLTALAILLSNGLATFSGTDVSRLRSLLILIAVLLIPMARLGWATTSLQRNRHR